MAYGSRPSRVFAARRADGVTRAPGIPRRRARRDPPCQCVRRARRGGRTRGASIGCRVRPCAGRGGSERGAHVALDPGGWDTTRRGARRPRRGSSRTWTRRLKSARARAAARAEDASRSRTLRRATRSPFRFRWDDRGRASPRAPPRGAGAAIEVAVQLAVHLALPEGRAIRFLLHRGDDGVLHAIADLRADGRDVRLGVEGWGVHSPRDGRRDRGGISAGDAPRRRQRSNARRPRRL